VSFDWSNKRILLTGGTGSFGRAFIAYALQNLPVKTICIFSRDELKQSELQELYRDEKRLRFFVGDVRDRDRVKAAMDGVDLVIHAAAMKRVEACEYNPFEAVQTNIIGTQNVVREAIAAKVSHVVALSTDKAVNPVNLYGATKLCLEKIVTANNNVVGKRGTKLSCVRYGNVAGSRGSIIPLFKNQAKSGVFTVTDTRMTRFWITLPEAIQFVVRSVETMKGGEVFTPKLPSFRVVDLAKAVNPKATIQVVGIRPGEKLHEVMLSEDENHGKRYDSGSNTEFLTVDQLRELIK
jgi:UDP-N-acetylglucosamine 4,6-dehydratase